MNIPRALLAGTLIGILLALTAPGAADAAPIPAMAAGAPVPASAVVQGQPWSAPTFPVDCRSADNQISCTPTDPSQVKAQQCFIKVLVSGSSTTVCTTYEGHVNAIQTAGGRPLLVQYGCSIGDVVCLTFENAGRGMALSATGSMILVADATRFDTDSILWSSAVEEWSFWQWAVLIVLFAAMVWAITAAVVSGDRSELFTALIRTMIAIPAVPITLWATGHVINAVDDLTWYVINRGDMMSLLGTLQSVMWAGGQANYYFAFLLHGLILLAVFLLMLVFTFRNIVLAALIMVGPVAWMLYPVRTVGPQWVVRYVSAVVVLLLTGPLTIGFLSLIIHGLANVKTIWDPQSWPLLFGLVLVAFAPFAVFGLFSFLGAVAADNMGSRIGSGAARAGTNAARSAARVPTRLGGRPAGVPRRPGNTPSPSASAKTASSSRPGGANAPAGTRTTSTARASSTGPRSNASSSTGSSGSSGQSRPKPPRPARSTP